jgi:DNA-binding NarL/FixJ family response regulator
MITSVIPSSNLHTTAVTVCATIGRAAHLAAELERLLDQPLVDGARSGLSLPSDDTPDAWMPVLRDLLQPLLSDRELIVCVHRLLGASDAEIAEALAIAPTTVRTHTSAIVRKLGLAHTRQIPLAVFRGLAAGRRPRQPSAEENSMKG